MRVQHRLFTITWCHKPWLLCIMDIEHVAAPELELNSRWIGAPVLLTCGDSRGCCLRSFLICSDPAGVDSVIALTLCVSSSHLHHTAPFTTDLFYYYTLNCIGIDDSNKITPPLTLRSSFSALSKRFHIVLVRPNRWRLYVENYRNSNLQTLEFPDAADLSSQREVLELGLEPV